MTALSTPNLIVAHPKWLTASIMLATIMQVLDTTIANVALPHMASSLNSTQEEVTWVLTSYIVASAIATPLTGWIADRLGRRTVFMGAIIGFTLTSVLCGIAVNLPEMVVFRIIQGLCGAVLIPLAQAVLLDINPKEKFGQAMAIYGAGIMVGPIIGPSLGGYLTETFDWRYVFLINLPVGAVAFAGVIAFLPKEAVKIRRFDMFGFAMLALGVGALQLLLDRGQGIDWFNSIEAWIYLGVSISGFRAFIIGLTLFSGLALLPPLLQRLMGYPVIETGWVMAPRGVGTMISMLVVGRLMSKADPRYLVLFGIFATAWSLYMMTGFELQMDSRLIVVSGVIQGFGLGFVFVPLSTLTFATIAPKFRGDATSLFSLVRNVGSGVGISAVTVVLSRVSVISHEDLASQITAQSPMVRKMVPQLINGSEFHATVVDGLVRQQAAMIGYIDDFYLMMWVTLAALPIVFLLRKPKAGKPAAPNAAAHAE